MVGVALVLLYFLLAALAAVIIMQSDRYAVRRTTAVDAHPQAVFARGADPAFWATLGAATVLEAEPDARIVLRLVSDGAESFATVALAPEEGRTVVDCVVSGRNSLVEKARDLLGHREKTLGPKIEKALAGLAASA